MMNVTRFADQGLYDPAATNLTDLPGGFGRFVQVVPGDMLVPHQATPWQWQGLEKTFKETSFFKLLLQAAPWHDLVGELRNM